MPFIRNITATFNATNNVVKKPTSGFTHFLGVNVLVWNYACVNFVTFRKYDNHAIFSIWKDWFTSQICVYETENQCMKEELN